MARKAARRTRIKNTETLGLSRFTAQHGDYRPSMVVDLAGELSAGRGQAMVRLLVNRNVSTVDKWLFEGGPGFEAPEAAAIEHMRYLWNIVGNGQPVTGAYDPSPSCRRASCPTEEYHEALLTIGEYQRQFPPRVWQAFENVVRWDQPAGKVGSHMASTPAEQRAHAKACVGFVASKVAEWRGYLGAAE